MGDKTQALKEQGAKVGLTINATKTKTKMMRICAKRSNGVFIEGEYVEEMDEFTYLGSTVSKRRSTDEDIQERIGKQGRHSRC